MERDWTKKVSYCENLLRLNMACFWQLVQVRRLDIKQETEARSLCLHWFTPEKVATILFWNNQNNPKLTGHSATRIQRLLLLSFARQMAEMAETYIRWTHVSIGCLKTFQKPTEKKSPGSFLREVGISYGVPFDRYQPAAIVFHGVFRTRSSPSGNFLMVGMGSGSNTLKPNDAMRSPTTE